MGIETLEHASLSAFVTTSPPGPLVTIVQKNNLEMVRCEPMKCTLLKTACAKRWNLANGKSETRHYYHHFDKEAAARMYMCVDCAQGEALAQNVAPTKIKKKKPWEGLMEERMENKPVPVCTSCKEKPAMLRKTTGKVVNGLCASCQAEKREATKAKKKAVKSKAENPKSSRQIQLDFTDYPEILESLVVSAKENMRPVGMQAIFLLKQVFSDV
jgi:hypothetical protein